jgi:histidyl-tRNA synthetase
VESFAAKRVAGLGSRRFFAQPKKTSDVSKDDKLKARLPRGLADRTATEIRASERMVTRIRRVYERYGFEPVETPLFEYSDALGKFLPDQDRPNEGVFSFDDDGEWVSLRYDLTAPLARYVAENWERLPKPYRSYRWGWVFRNEKPGPGRFRQFMQVDADTVGAASPAADAEMCMMAADTMEELGVPRGQYVIKVNSRKVLDGVMEAIGVTDERQKLTVLRAIDKYDRLGIEGVRLLLGKGRTDESGDFTKGAELNAKQIDAVERYYTWSLDHDQIWSLADDRDSVGFNTEQTQSRAALAGGTLADEVTDPVRYPGRYLDNRAIAEGLSSLVPGSLTGAEGVEEIIDLVDALRAGGFGSKRVRVDPSVVRGLEYYTGAVFEADLTFEIKDDHGRPVRFGSVGGGGRYDGLVGRFMGENVRATGFSLGVSRLQAALAALGTVDGAADVGPVVVLVMDRERIGDYQQMVARLRQADVPAELYLGSSGMRAQMKYADRRNAPLAVIQGDDEKQRGVVQIKDLALGKALSAEVADNVQWREERPGQEEVAEADLVEAVNRLLGRGERRPP